MSEERDAETTETTETTEETHTVEGAYYIDEGGTRTAVIFCTCAETGEGETWEEAGAAMDEHLAAMGATEPDDSGQLELPEVAG